MNGARFLLASAIFLGVIFAGIVSLSRKDDSAEHTETEDTPPVAIEELSRELILPADDDAKFETVEHISAEELSAAFEKDTAELIVAEELSATEAAKLIADQGPFPSHLFYEYIDKAMTEDPVTALIIRGFFHLNREGDFPAAKEDFAKAAEIDPRSVEAHRYLAMMLLGGYTGVEVDFDEAFTHLEKAVELGDKTAHTQNMIAIIYESRGDKSRALKHFKKALEYEPRDGHLLMRRIKEWEEAGIKAAE